MNPRMESTFRVLLKHTFGSHSIQLILLFFEASNWRLVDVHIVTAKLACDPKAIFVKRRLSDILVTLNDGFSDTLLLIYLFL